MASRPEGLSEGAAGAKKGGGPRSRSHGEGKGGATGTPEVLVHDRPPSRDLGLPTRQRVTPCSPARTPQPGPAEGWQVRGRGAPGLQCARR